MVKLVGDFILRINTLTVINFVLCPMAVHIDLLEMTLSQALQSVKENKIIDLKTVFLLQYMKMNENRFLRDQVK